MSVGHSMRWPDRSDRILARLPGAGLALFALSSIGGSLRSRPGDWAALAGAAIPYAATAGVTGARTASTISRMASTRKNCSTLKPAIVAPPAVP